MTPPMQTVFTAGAPGEAGRDARMWRRPAGPRILLVLDLLGGC